MGAKFSQDVQSDLNHSTLKELLSEKKFVERLREAAPALADDVRRDLRKLLTTEPTKSRTASGALSTTSESVPSIDDARTRGLWEIKEEDVALPSEIAESFETWKADPLAFLQNGSARVPMSLTEHYDYALSVRGAMSNKILWRFITTAYYDIISERSSSDRYLTKEAVAFVVDIICKSPSYDRKAVEGEIISWANEGAKYRALANKLGGPGCYFFYPDISEWIWKKYLPQKEYNRAAELLTRFGILDKARQSGAVGLAKSIETILKTPFRSTVQWIPPPQTRGSPRKAESLTKKRRRLGSGTLQRPHLPTSQSPQDFVTGQDKSAGSHLPAQYTGSCSFQGHSLVPTPTPTPSQSIESTSQTAERSRSEQALSPNI